jgi:hypothetical protein
LAILTSGCALFDTKEASDAFQQRLPRVGAPGRIPKSLGPGTEVTGVPTDPLDSHPTMLTFDGIKDGKVCFLKREVITGVETDGLSSIDVKDEDPSFLVKRIRATPFVTEAFVSLSQLPPRPTYLPNAGSRLGEPTVVGNRMVHLEGRETLSSTGKPYRSSYEGREWTFRLCGPAPRTSANTRYVTVVHPIVDGDGDQTVLYVWEITDEPIAGELRFPRLGLKRPTAAFNARYRAPSGGPSKRASLP